MTPEFKPTNPKDVVGIAKIPASVVSQLVMAEVAIAMFEGRTKYGRHNWRFAGVLASIYYDATRRHLDAWWEGEDIDPASGLSHITKAISSLMVLRDAMIQGMCNDDRPPQHIDVAAFFADLNEKAKGVLDTYGHLRPVHYTRLNVLPLRLRKEFDGWLHEMCAGGYPPDDSEEVIQQRVEAVSADPDRLYEAQLQFLKEYNDAKRTSLDSD